MVPPSQRFSPPFLRDERPSRRYRRSMTLIATEARADHSRATSRASDTKRAALRYLDLSGAMPISVIERDDGTCTIKLGGDGASAQWWAEKGKALTIARRARRFAGRDPDLSTALEAVARSATSVGAALTPHDVAIERAESAAARLDSYLDAMRKSGALIEFNKQFKRRRMEATLSARGFMSYASALARLKAALIPLLVAGARPAVGPGMFAAIFGAP